LYGLLAFNDFCFQQVSVDGVLTFDLPDNVDSSYLIAPFYADIDTRGTGTVYYRSVV